MEQHFIGEGSLWTHQHAPQEILFLEAIPSPDYQTVYAHENEKTLQLMEVFGFENVRGGKWCKLTITKPRFLL
jgi:hypothetical protein